MKTFKFVKVKFKNHPILENLVLDFRGQDGKTADTIIFAGENGAGKSTILDELYRIACGKTNFDTDIDVETDGYASWYK